MALLWVYRIAYIAGCVCLLYNFGSALKPLTYALLMFNMALFYDYGALYLDSHKIKHLKLRKFQRGFSFVALALLIVYTMGIVIGSQCLQGELVKLPNGFTELHLISSETFNQALDLKVSNLIYLWAVFPLFAAIELTAGVLREKLSS